MCGGEIVRKQLGILLLVLTIAIGFSGAVTAANTGSATMSSSSAQMHMKHSQMTHVMKTMHITHSQMMQMMNMMQMCMKMMKTMHISHSQMMRMMMGMHTTTHVHTH